ncbi:hypothetical protein [Methylocella silvestris]|uniref:hypothetical protein n=1 Tax=Methylocella silvestris TaxID=199596 RepID=UPI00059DEE29|nr:hypothetical protein [Methylocella silvestris]
MLHFFVINIFFEGLISVKAYIAAAPQPQLIKGQIFSMVGGDKLCLRLDSNVKEKAGHHDGANLDQHLKQKTRPWLLCW